MNESFRLEFKTLIESTHIPANAPEEYVSESWDRILRTVVSNLPKSLFRFRSANDYSITSFGNSYITVCHPSVFPDKYDSLVYVNTDEKYLLGEISKLLKPLSGVGIKISSDDIKSLIRFIQKKTELHKDYLKNNPYMRIACFTEQVDSKYMWDNYGDGYTGFALEYDPLLLFKRAGTAHDPINIFPVLYTKERFDATNDVLYSAAWDLVPQDIPFISEIAQKMCPGPDQLHWYRSYLYKSEDEYSIEKEWRLIHSKQDSTIKEDYFDIPDYDSVIGIYYGPDISSNNRDKLHEIAVRRGLTEYDVVVSNSPSYSLEVVKHR